MKLYYAPAACSLAAHIAAREAGVAVELVKVDIDRHTLEDDTDFYSINPRGYVPALSAYMARIAARPQVIAAMQAEGLLKQAA